MTKMTSRVPDNHKVRVSSNVCVYMISDTAHKLKRQSSLSPTGCRSLTVSHVSKKGIPHKDHVRKWHCFAYLKPRHPETTAIRNFVDRVYHGSAGNCDCLQQNLMGNIAIRNIVPLLWLGIHRSILTDRWWSKTGAIHVQRIHHCYKNDEPGQLTSALRNCRIPKICKNISHCMRRRCQNWRQEFPAIKGISNAQVRRQKNKDGNQWYRYHSPANCATPTRLLLVLTRTRWYYEYSLHCRSVCWPKCKCALVFRWIFPAFIDRKIGCAKTPCFYSFCRVNSKYCPILVSCIYEGGGHHWCQCPRWSRQRRHIVHSFISDIGNYDYVCFIIPKNCILTRAVYIWKRDYDGVCALSEKLA